MSASDDVDRPAPAIRPFAPDSPRERPPSLPKQPLSPPERRSAPAPAPARRDLPVSTLRLTASVTGIVAGGVAAFLVGPLADGFEPFASIRDAQRGDGYTVVMVSVIWVLAGALLQTPIAVLRRAPIGPGLAGLAAVLGYHLVIAVLMVPVAAYGPDYDPDYGGDDPAAAYPAFLTLVLFGFSLLAVTGCTFVSPPPADGPGSVQRRRASETLGLADRLAGVAALSWLCGILFVPAMVFDVVTGAGVPFVPAEQTWILACGLILAMPFALVAAVVVAGGRLRGWKTSASMTKRGFGPAFLFTVAATLLGGALFFSQLGRVFPRGMVTGLTLLAALAFALIGWRVVVHRARRGGLLEKPR
ncbi:hypothetical protein J2S43_001829 [Catenuloplanes nepalensis]|uniref:Integral membrane protein n=1 Tax=Catenuloplanes nepalensis TaxID=587533 RepID=A0ABT9MPI5_9ACTN|nr:hypothetical protein [Catenuloplanes nepalensis]MDP9793317.1 hypothetical protein [Catenuloplanes nepalensis]